MKFFDVGAARPATDGARLSAANDLVQRTLAQHGLAPQSGQTISMPAPEMAPINSLMERFAAPSLNTSDLQADLPDGATFDQVQFNCHAGSRDFRTYVPSSANEGVTGVVVMLHGCTQSPVDFAAGTGMNTLAEAHRFVVVYPAQSRGDNAQSCWNWFSRGDQRRDKGEPAILAGLTQQVCAEHGIGRDSTFVAGLSAGAAMAVILGETYPDVFAGIGAHSGLPYGSAKDVPTAFAAMAGSSQTPVSSAQRTANVRSIVFHGTADGTVHPSNGASIYQQATDGGASQTIETKHQGETGGRSFERRIASPVNAAPTLEFWSVDGLGHHWSGGKPEGSYTDPKGPNASAEMIRFFFETSTRQSEMP